jgi:hypothetical protein
MSRRLVLAFLLAPLAGCPALHDALCTPDSEPVPAGDYGGGGYALTVASDGSADLLAGCAIAHVDAVPVDDGEVHWTLAWRDGYGLPMDTGDIEWIDVALDGTYCGGVLDGTFTFPDGSTSDIRVSLGETSQIYFCD